MLKNIRSYFYNLKKFQKPLEKFIFPVVLLLYPIIGVTQGLDITDTTYSLSNYEFLGSIDRMWSLSTFLANVLGRIIMSLPGAGTMLGMNIYCSFIIGITALLAYYILQKWMPGWMIFIGEIIAEGLCWCPRVILYNYLTYLFMSLGVLLLFVGMFEWRRQNIFLFAAGVCLGLNVMVRFPNAAEAALILILWFYQMVTGSKFAETVKKTFVCIGGYLTGLLIPYIIISIMYGPMSYFNMIGSLFGMTEGASDYSAGGMISSIVSAYLTTSSNMVMMIPCVAAGIIMFLLMPEKYVWLKKLIYIMGLLILVKFYFSRGIFTRNYFYYDSVFQAAMMFVVISIVLCVIGSTGVLNGDKQEQTLAFAGLIIILLTPLGSNNYTFPVINNLFLVAPVSLWMLRRLMFRLGEKEMHFAWQAMITCVIIVLVVQSAIFHAKFSFVDGADGQVRDSYSKVAKVSAMKTTADNADNLDELSAALSENNLLDDKAIFFGGVPGLAYIFDIEPAIDTVWPDLDSYASSKFEDQLLNVSTSQDNKPNVIIGTNLEEYANINEKYDILLDYIANHDYNKVFENGKYIVYAPCN